jgi:mono/diheme cytochrome c family protein
MRSAVHVISPAGFAAFLRKQTQPVAPAGAAPAQIAAAGKKVFLANGCGACHTLADAGTTGSVGPNLGTVLKGKDVTFIRTSIVDPNAFIEKGYGPGIMPQTFGKTLSKDELAALVAYLKEVTG